MSPDRIGVFAYIMVKGKPKVVLVSSRDGDRWVLPKGRPKSRLSNRSLARLEAWEEAGIKGHFTGTRSMDVKLRQLGVDMNLRVYPYEVSKVARHWPEKIDRKRKIVSIKKAQKLVGRGGLRQAIRTLGHSLF